MNLPIWCCQYRLWNQRRPPSQLCNLANALGPANI